MYSVCMPSSHLGRVGVDGPDVVDAVRALEHHLLHIGANHQHGLVLRVLVYQIQEPHDIPHEFLADPLACAVNAELEGRGGVEHGCRKHRDCKGLAEPVNVGLKFFI